MIYTSYFANIKNLPENYIPIAICAKTPSWYSGLHYKKLAPKYGFFMAWKENKDNDFYVERYNEEVLSRLTQSEVLNELFDLLPIDIKAKFETNRKWYNSNLFHIVLICYEAPGDFCHRNLVSHWFSLIKLYCTEFLKISN